MRRLTMTFMALGLTAFLGACAANPRPQATASTGTITVHVHNDFPETVGVYALNGVTGQARRLGTVLALQDADFAVPAGFLPSNAQKQVAVRVSPQNDATFFDTAWMDVKPGNKIYVDVQEHLQSTTWRVAE